MNFLYKYPKAFEDVYHNNGNEIMKPVFYANVAVKKIPNMMDTYEKQMDGYK